MAVAPTGPAVGPYGVQGPGVQYPVAQPAPLTPAAGPQMTSSYGTGGGYGRGGSGFYPGTGTIPAAPPAAPPPPPPTPEFMTPAMQTYVNQFHQSQAAQQQAMNSALVQSLQGLGARRDAAAKAVATLPGEYNTAYANATADQRQAAKDAGAAFGVGAGSNIHAGEAANAARTAGDKTAGIAANPIIQSGVTADYTKGVQTLGNEDFQNKAVLAQNQQAFDLAMAQNQAQWQHDQQTRGSTLADDITKMKLSSSLDRENYDYKLKNPGPDGLVDTPYGRMSPYDAAKLGQSDDAASRKANFSSASGEARANQYGPNYLQYLQTGVSTSGQPAVAKKEVETLKGQIANDPDLLNWMVIHNVVSIDKSTGKTTWNV